MNRERCREREKAGRHSDCAKRRRPHIPATLILAGLRLAFGLVAPAAVRQTARKPIVFMRTRVLFFVVSQAKLAGIVWADKGGACQSCRHSKDGAVTAS